MVREPDDSRTDRELVAAVNGGDADAFGALYQRHRDWVGNLALRFTGDHALALDVVQETFLYFLRKFPGFTLTSQLQTFLYPAVRNLAIAARQRAGRNQAGSDGSELASLTAPEPLPETSSARDQLAAALGTLPEEQREVLLLRFVDGLALAEIGEALKIPTGTVKSRLHNALAALRKDPRTRDWFGE
jgi:RNA polymerase sigma-70 factor (ECF subfamily)